MYELRNLRKKRAYPARVDSFDEEACVGEPGEPELSRSVREVQSRCRKILHKVWLGQLLESAVHQPYLYVERMRMLDGLAAYRLESQLFVEFVERLDRIGYQQLRAAREDEQPRGVGHHLDQALALVVRVDNHPAKLEHFRREQSLE